MKSTPYSFTYLIIFIVSPSPLHYGTPIGLLPTHVPLLNETMFTCITPLHDRHYMTAPTCLTPPCNHVCHLSHYFIMIFSPRHIFSKEQPRLPNFSNLQLLNSSALPTPQPSSLPTPQPSALPNPQVLSSVS